MIGLLMLAQLQQTPSTGFRTGNQLLRDCQERVDACAGYIQGAIDMWIGEQDFGRAKHIVCIPSGVEVGQVKDVVVRWLNDNPENRHLDASGLVVIAAAQAFPCPDPKGG